MVKVVMRLLIKQDLISIYSLGFPKQNLGTFKVVITQPYGMVVVSGPTGSGKSTSLYAALKEIKAKGLTSQQLKILLNIN